MKKNIVMAVIFAMVMGMSTANAAEIPTESLPFYVNDESVIIAESHISDILDEVKNGLGYADAVNKANSRILNAVLNNETNGYGTVYLPILQEMRYFSIVRCICARTFTKTQRNG